MQMVNKVELLRAMLFTVEDFKTIKNLQDFPQFTQDDLDFMIEFKMIYEMGEPQLRKFIQKLEVDGFKIDAYSINYYTSVLLAGPFGNMIRDILGDLNQHTYWKRTPDSIARNSEVSYSAANTTSYTDHPVPAGTDNKILNKLPAFCSRILQLGLSAVEFVFRDSTKSMTMSDNTLPIANKNPQQRYNTEASGKLQQTAHGGYGVKDTNSYNNTLSASEGIQENLGGGLSEEDIRMMGGANDPAYAQRLRQFNADPTAELELPNQQINPLEPFNPLPEGDGSSSDALLPALVTTDPETGATSGEFSDEQIRYDSPDQIPAGQVIKDDNGNPVGVTGPNGKIFEIGEGGVLLENGQITEDSAAASLAQQGNWDGVNPTVDGNGPGGVDGTNSLADDIRVPPESNGVPVNSVNSGGAGSEFFYDSNRGGDFAKIFKVKKQVIDNGRIRIIELDLYGVEFDSDERRERLVRVTDKDYDKIINLNTDQGQLGNASSPGVATVSPTQALSSTPVRGLGQVPDDEPPPIVEGPPSGSFDANNPTGPDTLPPNVPEGDQPPPNATPIA